MNTNLTDFGFEDAMKFIMSFSRLGKKVNDLSRVQRLLNMLDNPQNSLEFIHIAGTNGKGSVSTMISEILCEAGIRTGLFTSPYILEFRDRIRFMGEMISKEDLSSICFEVKSKLDKTDDEKDFSGFEITMAIALIYFKSIKCDVVVFETGLGGLLDCTNIIEKPLVSVITSISHDHTAILGKSIKEISAQKAGIIKDNCPVVLSARNPGDAVKVITSAAKIKNSELIIPELSSLKTESVKLENTSFIYKNTPYSLSMNGEHQIINALSAIEAINTVKHKYKISESDIQKGLKKTFIIGRTEVLSSPLKNKKHYVILDGSHNDGGIKALSDTLSEVPRPITAIIGSLKSKDVRNSIPILFDCVDRIICVDDFTYDTIPKQELCSIINDEYKKYIKLKGKSIASCGVDTKTEYKKAMSGQYQNTVICGTLYIVSYIKNL